MRDQAPVLGDEHAAAPGRDDLVAVERVDAGLADGSRRATVIGGTQRLRGVLDQGYPETTTDVRDRREVSTLAIEVDYHDGLRHFACEGAGLKHLC